MMSFRPVAALLALAMLPAVARSRRRCRALRAELQALKNEYGARVDALEARIQQLEGEPGAGRRGGTRRRRPSRRRRSARAVARPRSTRRSR